MLKGCEIAVNKLLISYGKAVDGGRRGGGRGKNERGVSIRLDLRVLYMVWTNYKISSRIAKCTVSETTFLLTYRINEGKQNSGRL